MNRYHAFTVLLIVVVLLAAGKLAHASADTNNGPNNPSPGVLYPQAGDKICANHGFGPHMIYKAACAVGTWGAPDPVAP